MSLTSYRAAPPRVKAFEYIPVRMVMARFALISLFCMNERRWICLCALQTWQRPTLPRLETKYHWRWSVSRPSSEWDRVQPLRHNHQVGEEHKHEKLD